MFIFFYNLKNYTQNRTPAVNNTQTIRTNSSKWKKNIMKNRGALWKCTLTGLPKIFSNIIYYWNDFRVGSVLSGRFPELMHLLSVRCTFVYRCRNLRLIRNHHYHNHYHFYYYHIQPSHLLVIVPGPCRIQCRAISLRLFHEPRFDVFVMTSCSFFVYRHIIGTSYGSIRGS